MSEREREREKEIEREKKIAKRENKRVKSEIHKICRDREL